METRFLGRSGFKVPCLCLGTATFGRGKGFEAWGGLGVRDASRLVDLCLDAGVNMFDSADVYSAGVAEETLGHAIKGRRDTVIISTKATFRFGAGANDVGSSRSHLIKACEGSLRRLGTDYIDLYQLHGFDAFTPVDEVVQALDDLVRAGKIRYLGCSNFSGWHLMKSLASAEKAGRTRHVAHQAYYSLIGRDYEWELMPLALDQGVGTVAWSPLGMGRLGGKLGRNRPWPAVSRLNDAKTREIAPPVSEEKLYQVTDALEALARDTGRTMAQIAINWVLQRPSVSTVIIGARDEGQLRENLGAAGWALSATQVKALDAASAQPKIYPYWHQAQFAERNPFPAG